MSFWDTIKSVFSGGNQPSGPVTVGPTAPATPTSTSTLPNLDLTKFTGFKTPASSPFSSAPAIQGAPQATTAAPGTVTTEGGLRVAQPISYTFVDTSKLVKKPATTDAVKAGATKDATVPENAQQYATADALKKAAAADASVLDNAGKVTEIAQKTDAQAAATPGVATGVIPSDVSDEHKSALQTWLDKAQASLDKAPEAQTTIRDYAKSVMDELGISEANQRLVDVNKILAGSRDDIRKELTNAGGLVTDSGVEALYHQRNKALLSEQANLEDAIKSKESFASTLIDAGKADITNSLDQFKAQTDIELKMADLFNTISQAGLKTKDFAKSQIDLAMQGNFWDTLSKEQQQQLWTTAGYPGEAAPEIHKGTDWSEPYKDSYGNLVQVNRTTGEENVLTRPTTGGGGDITWGTPYTNEAGQLVQESSRGEVRVINQETSDSKTESFAKEVSQLQPGDASEKDLEQYALSIGLDPQDTKVQGIIRSAPKKGMFQGLTDLLTGK